MKKLLLTLLVAILSWPAFSQEPSTYSYTFEAVTSGLSGNAKFDNLSLGEITWNYLNVQSSTSTLTVLKDSSGRGWQFGSKGKMPQEVSFSTSDFVGKEIIEIECQIGGDGGSFTYSIDNAPLENANNASYAAASGTTTVAANWTGSMVCNSELKLAINPVQGTGKKALFLKSITIKYQEPSTGDPDKVTPVLTWSETEVTTILGGEFNAPQLTVEPDANKADIVEWLQYYSSDEEVAMIDQNNGEIVINGVGTATIRVELDETAYELYNPAFAEYKLIVTNTPASISCNTTETAVTLGKEEEFVYPKFICDPEELELSDNIVFTSSDPTVATVKNEGLNYTLNFLKAGETTITVSINENGYEPAEASFKLTVVEEGGEIPVEPTSGTIVLTVEDLLPNYKSGYEAVNYTHAETGIKLQGYATKNGGTGLQANGGYLFVTENPNNINIAKVTVSAKTSSSKTTTLAIKTNNKAYTFTSGTTKITSLDGNSVLSQNITTTETEYSADVNNIFFGMRNDTNGGQIVITKLTIEYNNSTKQPAGLEFAEAVVNTTTDAAYTGQELTNPNGLTVAYTSDNEAVATVDAEGKVTLTGKAGKAVISAAFEGNDNYNAQTVSYTINVQAAASTLAQYLELAAENGAEALMNCELVVTYAQDLAKEGYVYVTDRNETAYGLVYKKDLGYNTGDVIPAGWSAQTKIYNGLLEIIPTGDMPAATETAVVNYDIFDTISEEYINRIVKLEDVVITDGKAEINGQSYTVYNKFGVNITTDGVYNLTVAITTFNGLQLYPIEDYRLTNEKIATMFIMVTTMDGKGNPDESGEYTDDFGETVKITEKDKVILIKFEPKEDGHKVFFRHTPATTETKVASRAAIDGFTEYDGNRFGLAGNGKFEYYTEDANGIRSDVKSVQFDGVTGIEDITVDGAEGEATYYNLQGVRIERPAKGGVYVRVAAGKATKVVF
ncbi:hypothetical protein [Duncaniella dubosii]|uniref:hypothetical protein n=1 Tax=Duncaniella dubosii TaxID=2518971 RepID=UPI0032B1554F